MCLNKNFKKSDVLTNNIKPEIKFFTYDTITADTD